MNETAGSKDRASGNAGEKLRSIGGFEILSKLGSGAMGAVFKARQTSLDRVVALKILPPKFAKNKQFVERFRREARASAALNHPNIVQGIDVGHDKGLNFFVMEFIDGETVGQRFKREGPLPLQDVLEIGRQTALALAHAHNKGLIHRDIKPDNLMIAKTGHERHGMTIKVMDLGLARAVVGEDAAMTMAGKVLGTPYYISPEQARGDPDLTPACDLYCLGGTLLHIATGKTPYSGENSASLLVKHLSEPVPDPKKMKPDLPDTVAAIIRKLLAKKPEDRYASAQALAEDLERVLKGDRPELVSPRLARAHSTGPVRPVTRKVTTGPIQRFTTKGARPITLRGEDETGKVRPTENKGFLVLPGTIGAIVIVGIIGIVLSNSGPSVPDPAEVSRKARQKEARARRERDAQLKQQTQARQMALENERRAKTIQRQQNDKELEKRFAEAETLASKTPDDFAGQEKALRELLRDAVDSPLAAKVNVKLEVLAAKRKAAADAAVKAWLAQAKAKAAGGDHDGALAHLAALPTELRTPEIQVAQKSAQTEIQTRAIAAGQKLLQEAAALAAENKLKEALEAYTRAAGFKFKPIAMLASRKVAELQRALQTAKGDADRAAAVHLATLVKSLGELFQKKDFGGARLALSRALTDPRLARRRAAVHALREAHKGWAPLLAMAAERLAGSGGKGVRISASKNLYLKLENERLHYKDPRVSVATSKTARAAEWPELLELSGMYGEVALFALRAAPQQHTEALGGMLALLGEPDHARFLFKRAGEKAPSDVRARLKAWEELLGIISGE